MNEIGIITLLTEAVRTYHRELRQKIANQFGLDGIANPQIPAHITLKYSFPVEDMDAIEEVVQEFSLSQVKTKWVLKGFNYFINAEKRVIFMDVIPSDDTRKAHANLLERLRKIGWVQWGQFDNANMHYHVTLAAIGITPDNFEAVWAFVKQQDEPHFEAFFDNLAIIQGNGDYVKIYKSYRFH